MFLSTIVAAILFTCFRLNYAVFKKKINSFKVVNRKNYSREALGSKKDGNWRVTGEGIMLYLRAVEPQCEEERSLIS